jgi:catechol 2,3-dioxygenase-like lactoylglutathione lyase family enzyme
MITNVSLTTVYCLDQTATRDFYVDVLGFESRVDLPMGPTPAGSPSVTPTSPSSRSP